MGYYEVLGLHKEPFSTSPDPAFFYRSRHHRAALANLLIEMRLKRGLSVVLGDIGTGKTTLGRKLIQMLKERSGFLFHIVLNPSFRTEDMFFEALVRRFGIDVPINPNAPQAPIDYWDVLERFLYRRGLEEGQTIVLVIDEAHKLNPMSLEALRVLLNYETNEAKLLQLVLLGQIELLPILQSMPNLNQRISMKYILQPLNVEEASEMIEFRLREAGYQSAKSLFTDDAIDEIHRHTEGYPRRIALFCHRALRLAVMHNEKFITKSTIDELVQQERDVGWTQTKILQKSGYLGS